MSPARGRDDALRREPRIDAACLALGRGAPTAAWHRGGCREILWVEEEKGEGKKQRKGGAEWADGGVSEVMEGVREEGSDVFAV